MLSQSKMGIGGVTWFPDMVSTKRKYTLLSSQVLKTEEGGRWKVGGLPHPPLRPKWTKNHFKIQRFCSCVTIFWNSKMRLTPVWSNSMEGVVHPWPFPLVLLDFEYIGLTHRQMPGIWGLLLFAALSKNQCHWWTDKCHQFKLSPCFAKATPLTINMGINID